MTNKQKIKLAIGITILVLFAILIFQNLEPVKTTVFFDSFTMPLAALILATFLSGVGAGFLLFGLKSKKKHQNERDSDQGNNVGDDDR